MSSRLYPALRARAAIHSCTNGLRPSPRDSGLPRDDGRLCECLGPCRTLAVVVSREVLSLRGFRRLPGMRDGPIQDTRPLHRLVGLPFRGPFPGPRGPDRADCLGAAGQGVRQGRRADPLRATSLAGQRSTVDPAGHCLRRQGRQQTGPGGVPASAEDRAEQRCGVGGCRSDRVRSGRPGGHTAAQPSTGAASRRSNRSRHAGGAGVPEGELPGGGASLRQGGPAARFPARCAPCLRHLPRKARAARRSRRRSSAGRGSAPG